MQGYLQQQSLVSRCHARTLNQSLVFLKMYAMHFLKRAAFHYLVIWLQYFEANVYHCRSFYGEAYHQVLFVPAIILIKTYLQFIFQILTFWALIASSCIIVSPYFRQTIHAKGGVLLSFNYIVISHFKTLLAKRALGMNKHYANSTVLKMWSQLLLTLTYSWSRKESNRFIKNFEFGSINPSYVYEFSIQFSLPKCSILEIQNWLIYITYFLNLEPKDMWLTCCLFPPVFYNPRKGKK